MNFWNTYQEKSGLDSWKITNIVAIPINAHNKLKYTNVDGVMVLTYFSLNLKFGEQDADIRANFGFHFNKEKK